MRGRRDRVAAVGALLVLSALTAALQHLSVHTELRFLLFPPLASLGYRAFRNPHSEAARVRSMVLAPTLGSVCGLALHTWLGLTALAAALAVAAGIAAVEALRADAPPTLAVAVLALFTTDPGWAFPLSVLTATSSLHLIFLAWLRLLR